MAVHLSIAGSLRLSASLRLGLPVQIVGRTHDSNAKPIHRQVRPRQDTRYPQDKTVSIARQHKVAAAADSEEDAQHFQVLADPPQPTGNTSRAPWTKGLNAVCTWSPVTLCCLPISDRKLQLSRKCQTLLPCPCCFAAGGIGLAMAALILASFAWYTRSKRWVVSAACLQIADDSSMMLKRRQA